jgi:hypothetical protein
MLNPEIRKGRSRFRSSKSYILRRRQRQEIAPQKNLNIPLVIKLELKIASKVPTMNPKEITIRKKLSSFRKNPMERICRQGWDLE